MQTTINIPDDLLRRTKAEAALRGLRLDDLVCDALERLIPDAEDPPQPRDQQLPDHPWIKEQRLGPGMVLPLITAPTGRVGTPGRSDCSIRPPATNL